MGKLVVMCEDLPDNLYRNSCFLSRTDVSQVQFHIDLDLLFATVCSVAYVLQWSALDIIFMTSLVPLL